MRQYEISPVLGAIAVRNVNTTTPNAYEYYQFAGIKSVVPASNLGFGTREPDNQRKNPVRYTDKLEFIINFHNEDNPPIKYNIADVANQAGWTYDFAGLVQAVADINSWINSAAGTTAALSGNAETPLTIESAIDGSTPTPCKGYSIMFEGSGGALNGVTVPNGYISNKGASSSNYLLAESYTVPTVVDPVSGLARVVISYVV